MTGKHMIWLNGDIATADGAISANDRGLLLGEAVFETMQVKNAVPQFWAAHLARLREACDAFYLKQDYTDDALREAAAALLAAHDNPAHAILRLTVTGGDGGRGLVAQSAGAPNVLMHVSDMPPAPEALSLHVSDTVRLAGASASAHKSTAYLDNILARRQAIKAGADEALMLNQFGRIACAASGTVYLQHGHHLLTPPVSEGALPGTIRAALLQLGEIAGLRLSEGLIEPDSLTTADGMFISNSVLEIVPAYLGNHIADTAGEAQKKQGRALRNALPQFDKF